MRGQSNTQRLLEKEQNLQDFQDREKSIHQLNWNLTFVDMNTTFKDLATMVDAQGDLVDSIRVYVSEAQVRVRGNSTPRTGRAIQECCRKYKVDFVDFQQHHSGHPYWHDCIAGLASALDIT